jgi:hypothetical protein
MYDGCFGPSRFVLPLLGTLELKLGFIHVFDS